MGVYNPAEVADIEAKCDAIKEAVEGHLIGEGSVIADWNSDTGFSDEAGADLLGGDSGSSAIPGISKLISLLLDVSALTDGAKIHVKLFTKINDIPANGRKVYDTEFTVPTGTTPPDTDGLWIVNGTVFIHDQLRVEVYSNTPADDGKAIGFTYALIGGLLV